LRAVGGDGGSGRLQEHKAPADRPEPLARQHVFSRERGLKDLRLPLGSLLAPSAVPTHPAPDHHAPPVIAAAATASGVEALGHAVELGAPRDVFLEALLGLLGDADPLAARLLAETSDASGCGAFLLLGRRPEIGLGQRADDHDLVVFDGDLHPREPAVREPPGSHGPVIWWGGWGRGRRKPESGPANSGLTGDPTLEPPQQPEGPKDLRGRWESLKQSVTGTTAALPQVLRLVWEASRPITIG